MKSSEYMSFQEENALRTTHRPFIHPNPVVMFTFSSKVKPAIWWNTVSQWYPWLHTIKDKSYEIIGAKPSINKINDLPESSITETTSSYNKTKSELGIRERRSHLCLCFDVCGSPRRSEIGKLRRAHLWKYDSNASVPAEVKITSSCNLQKGADWGRQRGNLGVLGYPTVLEREKKWPALLGYLLEFP